MADRPINMHFPLWSNVFGSGFEAWPWWLDVEYLDSADWDKPGVARLTIRDPHDEDASVTKDVDLAKLVEAWNETLRTSARLGTGQPLDPEDLDASDGDAVLQTAVLGEVIFG